jgi:beta-xylosidase
MMNWKETFLKGIKETMKNLNQAIWSPSLRYEDETYWMDNRSATHSNAIFGNKVDLRKYVLLCLEFI